MQHTQQLFLEALKAALKNEQVEWNNKLEAQEWMDLFRMAEVHQILPMIYEAVYRSPAAGQADPQILAPAKAQMVRTVIMQTQKTGEFEPLYGYLRESGICPLVVKGIVCRNIYPNPDYRISGDEDLLIRPEDFRKCHDLLHKYGMQTSEQDMDAEELESVYEVPYGKKGSLIYIELHKSLFPPESEAYGDLNRFFANVHEDAIDIRIDGTDMLMDLLDSGIYGNANMSRKHSSNMTLDAVAADKNGKKAGNTVLKSLFPSAKKLEGRYPYLKKHPILLPIAWTDRILKYRKETVAGGDNAAADSVKIGNQRIELMKKYGIIKK